jgi:hypothetical protein
MVPLTVQLVSGAELRSPTPATMLPRVAFHIPQAAFQLGVAYSSMEAAEIPKAAAPMRPISLQPAVPVLGSAHCTWVERWDLGGCHGVETLCLVFGYEG